MFKQCTMCNRPWNSREDFVADPQIVIVGYQVNFVDLELGYFLFNHMACQTTLAIHAKRFVDLYQGPVYAARKTGTDECEKHCIQKDDLNMCAAECECAYVREVIRILRNWPPQRLRASDSQQILSA